MTDPQNGQLNPIGLNLLGAASSVTGHLVSAHLAGAELLASEWKYRWCSWLALFLEDIRSAARSGEVRLNETSRQAQIRLPTSASCRPCSDRVLVLKQPARFIASDCEITTQNDIDCG